MPCAIWDADAGVMVTASHNPPGLQRLQGVPGRRRPDHPPGRPRDRGRASKPSRPCARCRWPHPTTRGIVRLDEAVVERYLVDALAQSFEPAARDLTIVYTPMHGVGGEVATRLLREAGSARSMSSRTTVRPRSRLPDGRVPQPRGTGRPRPVAGRGPPVPAPTWSWPTTPTPTASASPCPPTPDGERWRALTGDEIGVLLADHVLRHTTGDDRLVVTSIVSSTMLSRMAAARRRALRPDPHRIQMAGPGGRQPPRLALRLRLRGGAGLLRRHHGAGQGRDHGGPALRRVGGRPEGRGPHRRRPPRRSGPPVRRPCDPAVVLGDHRRRRLRPHPGGGGAAAHRSPDRSSTGWP